MLDRNAYGHTNFLECMMYAEKYYPHHKQNTMILLLKLDVISGGMLFCK